MLYELLNKRLDSSYCMTHLNIVPDSSSQFWVAIFWLVYEIFNISELVIKGHSQILVKCWQDGVAMFIPAVVLDSDLSLFRFISALLSIGCFRGFARPFVTRPSLLDSLGRGVLGYFSLWETPLSFQLFSNMLPNFPIQWLIKYVKELNGFPLSYFL